jgi:hypothetical protein
MNLILGLTAQALNFAFNIPGLEDPFLLQIPIKGRNGNVEIDKKRAAGRITALIAQLQGDPKAKLLGNVLDAAMSNLIDPFAPEPTTSPFPWDANSKEAINKNDRQLQQDENNKMDLNPKKLLKGLEKGASQLLEKIIK